MYRSLYDFTTSESGALSFKENDVFTVMDARDAHWWLVQNGTGVVGFVPGNYLTKKTDVGHSEVIRSIDRAIEAILLQVKASGNVFTQEQKTNLQKLKAHKKKTIEEQQKEVQQIKRTAPVPPSQMAAKSITNNTKLDRKSSKRSAPPPPATVQSTIEQPTEQDPTSQMTSLLREKTSPLSREPQQSNREPDTSPPRMSAYSDVSSSIDLEEKTSVIQTCIPSGIGAQLLELIRTRTRLSHAASDLAVRTVLTHLKQEIPDIADIMDQVMADLQDSKLTNNIEDKYDGCNDSIRLDTIFEELAACKDDSQQRSWFLHEDELIITGHLEELINILGSANPELCRHALEKDKYNAVHNLAQYYQMETRVSIRLLLLQAFGSLCGVSKHVISELLTSILPLELVRDVLSDTNDLRKLSYSLLVLSMVFCMGESVPYQHYEHLNESFILTLLAHIEDPPQGDSSIADLCFKVILSYNLHFELPEDNLIMKAMDSKGTAKTFTEKLLLLVNREDDPVRIFDHEPRPPNSLLKFLSDLYSTRRTAVLLYTNDAMVLLDIVVRQLADLTPGDPMRTEYLSLLHLIVQNTDYNDHLHRQQELQRSLNAIALEDSPDSQMDQYIVQRIFKDFPNIFTLK